MGEKFLVANHIVPDNEVWVSLKTFDTPFSKQIEEAMPKAPNNARDAITLLETEIEFISGDCGKIDLGVVANKLNAVVALLRPIAPNVVCNSYFENHLL